MVDGLPWPAADEKTVWLPPGVHAISAAPADNDVHLVRLNAELQAARRISATMLEFSYRSSARALAILDRKPLLVDVDGASTPLQLAGSRTILLPPGQHIVTITVE